MIFKRPHALEDQRRRACTKENVDEYFSMIRELIDKHQYCPELIFNMDETMMKISPSRLKVISTDDFPEPTIPMESDVQHMTLCFCVSAAGEHVKTLVILPRKLFPEELSFCAKDFDWSGQDKGWMTKGIFSDWIVQIFVPFVEATRANNPSLSSKQALLILDSHASRGSVDALHTLRSYDIDVATIPSHTSALLQPLDRGINRQFKRSLESRPYITVADTLPEKRKYMFERMLEGHYNVMNPALIRKSFKVTGIHPFNCSAVGALPLMSQMTPSPPKTKRTRTAVKIDGRVITSEEVIGELEGAERKKHVKLHPVVTTGTSMTPPRLGKRRILVDSDSAECMD